MKRRFVFIGLFILLVLGGCRDDEGLPAKNESAEQPGFTEVKADQLHSLHADLGTFHFSGNWLSESEVLFVERKTGEYKINTFNVDTGDIKTLYTDPSVILDVFVHPSRQYLLVQTSDTPSSATLKLLTTEGTVEKKVTIESAELEIEWNDEDPLLMLLTAFYEDWTFDVFLFNGSTGDVDAIEMEDPFPKWAGASRAAVKRADSHELDGSNIWLYDIMTKEWSDTGLRNVIYLHTYKDSIVIAREQEKQALFQLLDKTLKVQQEWTVPLVSNYSQWIMPAASWVSEEELVMPVPSEGGLIDDAHTSFQLTRIKNSELTILAKDIEPIQPRCSPSGKRCLIGNSYVTLIEEGKTPFEWILFNK